MLNITVRNVNKALSIGAAHLLRIGEVVTSRGLKTIEYPMPVCTTYTYPRERVLFSPVRDANPFFHFMESLWILAGRNDVKWLSQFNSRIHEFSDDGKVFHAAYGYRMKNGIDQISMVIDILNTHPDTRQAVIAIWDPVKDLGIKSKDIPCNDLIFFKIRNGRLNMTVCCRSNDMLWGAYGANVVQFSTLQEYIACNLNIKVGVYRQISDSFHVYVDGPGGKLWNKYTNRETTDIDLYEEFDVYPYPSMMTNPRVWDIELNVFLENPLFQSFKETYFRDVAKPMYRAWVQYKSGDIPKAVDIADTIAAEDWQIACSQWLKRRVK